MLTNAEGLEPFDTERLHAREWTVGDVNAAFAMYSDMDVQRGLSGKTEPDLESQRVSLLRAIQAYRDRPKGTGYWALERKEDGQVVGATIVKPIPGDEEKIEVGWHLAKIFWGNGYATEAAKLAVPYAFRHLPIDRLYCLVRPWNEPSLKVAARLGFEVIGLTDRYYECESVIHELTRVRAVELGLSY